MARRKLAGLAFTLLAGAAALAQEAPLGKPSAFELVPAGERIIASAGSRLFAAPDPAAATLAVFDVDTDLEVIERDGAWTRVRHAGRLGWLGPQGTVPRRPRPPAPDPGAGGLTTVVPAPPLAAPDPSAARLTAALAYLGTSSPAGRVGPFPLFTDALDERRLARLQLVGQQLPEVYRARYGLAVASAPAGAIVLFSSPEDYLAFVGQTEELADLAARGHALYGIAALYAGRDATEEVTSILVHEMAHLLNRVAFGRRLPSWLEEGLANDLAWSEIDRDGRLALGSRGGSTRLTRPSPREGTMVVERRGPQASHRKLLEAWKRRSLPSLPELLGMPWAEFVEPNQRRMNYAQSTEFVRFLLDGGVAPRATGFRDFLEAVAAGAKPDVTVLETHLGEPLDRLERAFGTWLTRQVALNR